jgi:hypothetical protein
MGMKQKKKKFEKKKIQLSFSKSQILKNFLLKNRQKMHFLCFCPLHQLILLTQEPIQKIWRIGNFEKLSFFESAFFFKFFFSFFASSP